DLQVVGRVLPRGSHESAVEVRRTFAGPFPPARDAAAMAAAARGAFDKLGDTHLELTEFNWRNDESRFVPVSRLNQARRDLADDLEAACQSALTERVARVKADMCPRPRAAAPTTVFRWSIKADCVGFVDAFEADDWSAVDELVLDVVRDHPTTLTEKLDHFAPELGRGRIRLALPALTRKWEAEGLRRKVEKLRAAGWRKWEAANLSAWRLLDLDPAGSQTDGLDLATDWSVYALNRAAARQLEAMGVT